MFLGRILTLNNVLLNALSFQFYMLTIQRRLALQLALEFLLQFFTILSLMTSANSAFESAQMVSSPKSHSSSAFQTAQISQSHYTFIMRIQAAWRDAHRVITQTLANKSAQKSALRTQTYSLWKSITPAFPNALQTLMPTQAHENASSGVHRRLWNMLTTQPTNVYKYARQHLTIMVWTELMEIKCASWPAMWDSLLILWPGLVCRLATSKKATMEKWPILSESVFFSAIRTSLLIILPKLVFRNVLISLQSFLETLSPKNAKNSVLNSCMETL